MVQAYSTVGAKLHKSNWKSSLDPGCFIKADVGDGTQDSFQLIN